MDLFISAFMTFGSYLIISYFVYNLFGRNRKIPIVILSLLLLSSLLRLLNTYRAGYQFNVVFIVFMVYVFPVLAAFYVFLSISGGLPLLRIKRQRKLKNISSDIQTRYFLIVIYLILGFGSLLFGVGAYLFVDDYLKWVILVFAAMIFILSSYLLVIIRKIKNERVILIIGRENKTYYQYIIPKQKFKVLVTDFYSNENYIVDPIGELTIEDDLKGIEKHYLYWIATNDLINMSDEKHLSVFKPLYEDIVDKFEKYHYRQMYIKYSKNKVTIIKEKLIR